MIVHVIYYDYILSFFLSQFPKFSSLSYPPYFYVIFISLQILDGKKKN